MSDQASAAYQLACEIDARLGQVPQDLLTRMCELARPVLDAAAARLEAHYARAAGWDPAKGPGLPETDIPDWQTSGVETDIAVVLAYRDAFLSEALLGERDPQIRPPLLPTDAAIALIGMILGARDPVVRWAVRDRWQRVQAWLNCQDSARETVSGTTLPGDVRRARLAQPGAACEPDPPCAGMLSARDLANRYQVKADALRKRLKRAVDNHTLTPPAFQEIRDPGLRGARYLFLDSAVTHLIRAQLVADLKADKRRTNPSKICPPGNA
jgi:hypothetical protein